MRHRHAAFRYFVCTVNEIVRTLVCVCGALRRAAQRVSLMYDRQLTASGLTIGQYSILAEIMRSGDCAPTLGVLAHALAMDRAALTHTLKPLIRDGLVELAMDVSDRRARLVYITAQGGRKFAAARGAWVRAQDRFAQSFGPDQTVALRALLRLVVAADLGEMH